MARSGKLNAEIIEPDFLYKGRPYAHHSKLNVDQLAFKQLIRKQYVVGAVIAGLIIVGLILNWHFTVTLLVAILSVYYIVQIVFDFILTARSLQSDREIIISEAQLTQPRRSWPKYTVLCPLYNETAVLPQFIKAMSALDYPTARLQILLLIEEDDTVAQQALAKMKLSKPFEVVVVPHSDPKTKPKALNYNLKRATGDYVVIYDAEDIPAKTQLKSAVLAFEAAAENVACIQCKLDYYNPRQNVLTRVFTVEYALWFDLTLPGLQSLNAPIPLGGTSNHFQTKLLKEIGGWDAFNVTEDADLGIRLAKLGFRTALTNSTTFEEASSKPRVWFNQRRRWIKGYMQTYLVHTRNFKDFQTSFKNLDGILFQLVVGGKVALMFLNPIMLVITILYFVFRSSIGDTIESFFPAPILYLAVFSVIFGNFAYFYDYMLGAAKRGHYELIKFAYLVPLYWLAMSIAAYSALYEMVVRPHYWHKTSHGHHLDNDSITHRSLESIK